MKWFSVLLILTIFCSCKSDKLYSVNSRKYQKWRQKSNSLNNAAEKANNHLSIQNIGSFNLPNCPADVRGYGIFPQVFDSANSYIMNDEMVEFDTFFGNHYVDSSLISPFGRYNIFIQNGIQLDSFYLPRRLLVNSNNDFEVSQGDTFTWKTEPKNNLLLFYITDDYSKTYHYLLKDDGQFIVPKYIMDLLSNSKYPQFSFSRDSHEIIMSSNGDKVSVTSFSGSTGMFQIKKATLTDSLSN